MTEKKYIDATAWLEQCNKSYMNLNLAKKIIDEAPTAPIFGQWIDAEKQLPTEADEYIVMIAGAASSTVLYFAHNDEGDVCERCRCAEGASKKEWPPSQRRTERERGNGDAVTATGGVWFKETEDSTNFYKVTYWMALPEGPGRGRTVPMTGANKATRPASSTTYGGPPVVASRQQPPTGEGYEDACPYKDSEKPNVCRCKACGAEIVWVTMQDSGKKMPCDAALIRCREDKDAKTSVITPNGMVMRGVEAPDGVADFWGHRSHFETCPQANQFRKRGEEK